MSDEMKLLMAMCEAMGFEVEIKQVSIAVQGDGDSVAVPFGREYVVTKRADEVDLINDTFNNMFGDVKADLSALSVREEYPVDCKKVFMKFLGMHNATGKFFAAKRGNNEYCNDAAASFISSSFTWSETVEGGGYWDHINGQWLAHLKTVKGES